MKIRKGFVSNSSSSSYILESDGVTLGREATLEWLKNPENNNKELLVIGIDMNEGDDIFYLDNAIRKVILDHEERFLNGKGHWCAYPNVISWKMEPWVFGMSDEESDIEAKINPPYVIRVYKDYTSDSEESIQDFIIRYLYTYDERSFLWDFEERYGYVSLEGYSFMAYTDKMEVPKDGNVPEDWEDIYIGINEFGGTEGGLFSCKKLTEGDLKRIKSGKEKFKEGTFLYNNLILQKRKSNEIFHFKEGDYHIVMMNGIYDKVKALKIFLKDEEV